MSKLKVKLKKGDPVVVLTGRDKGKKGDIVRIMPSEGRVIVAGVNLRKHHTKPGRGSAGGIVEKEGALPISNVAYADPKSGKATRIGYKTLEDGRKVRVAKKSGEVIDG